MAEFIPNVRAGVTDLLFATIVNSKFTRRKLNLVLVFALSFFVRNIIDLLVYLVIRTGYPIVDFLMSVCVTISVILLSPYIEDSIGRYEVELQALTNKLVDNYTFEQYKKWRKRAVFSTCMFLLVFLYFVEVTSAWLMVSIVHFLITTYALEKIDDYRDNKGAMGKFKRWLHHRFHRPKTKVLANPDLIQSYRVNPVAPVISANPETPLKPTKRVIKIGSKEITVENDYAD